MNMKNTKNITQDQIEAIDRLVLADAVYDSVVAQLKIDFNDVIYVTLITGMLKRQTRDHLVFSIWNSMDDAQLGHFRDFMNQMAVISPYLSHEDLLMRFAMMYPELKAKIFAGLTVFFQGFIKKFNEVAGASLVSGKNFQQRAI